MKKELTKQHWILIANALMSIKYDVRSIEVYNSLKPLIEERIGMKLPPNQNHEEEKQNPPTDKDSNGSETQGKKQKEN